MCVVNRIPLEQFAANAKKSVNTIKRNYTRIPGITRINGEFQVLSGTRYPFQIKKFSIDTSKEKRRALLIAISRYEYIDCYALRIEQRQFKRMLRDLLNAGLIEDNGLANHYGANAYDCTELGAQVASEEKWKTIDRITELVAETAGHFTGTVISEIVPV